MKRHRRLIDAILVLLALGVLALLLTAPPATTPGLPADDHHRQLVDLAFAQGKKAAEKRCENCHNPANIPFSEEHPAGYRCLFCHRLPPQKN